jgi:hypothetical protein
MPVPGDVIFGPASGGKHMTFDRVRSMSNEERVVQLKRRLDTFLIAQIRELGRVDGKAKKVYSPFPLAVMSCVAAETIGRIFFLPSLKVDSDERSRACFRQVMKQVDRKLYGPMRRGFKEQLRKRWPDDDLTELKSAADVMYKFFRNTMTHGYAGRGVYLTEDATDSWDYKEGFLVLHPYWYWEAVERVYEELFARALSRSGPEFHHCSEYLRKVLG